MTKQLASINRDVTRIFKRPSNFINDLTVLDISFKNIKSSPGEVSLFKSEEVTIVWTFKEGMALYRNNKELKHKVVDYKINPPKYTEPNDFKLRGKTLSLVRFKETRNNFAHFILEKFPLLFYFDILLGLCDFDYYLVDEGNINTFLELAEIIGLKGKPVPLGRDGSLEIEELYFSNHLSHPMNKLDPIIYKSYRDLVSKLHFDNDIKYPKIYIERKRGRRGIINDSEFQLFLENQGFVSISFDNMPMVRQIEIINKAEIILSVHGAALANLVFTNNKKIVTCIEILPNKYATPAFWILSRSLGVQYYAIEPKGQWSLTRDFKYHQADVHVDIDKLRDDIGHLL